MFEVQVEKCKAVVFHRGCVTGSFTTVLFLPQQAQQHSVITQNGLLLQQCLHRNGAFFSGGVRLPGEFQLNMNQFFKRRPELVCVSTGQTPFKRLAVTRNRPPRADNTTTPFRCLITPSA